MRSRTDASLPGRRNAGCAQSVRGETLDASLVHCPARSGFRQAALAMLAEGHSSVRARALGARRHREASPPVPLRWARSAGECGDARRWGKARLDRQHRARRRRLPRLVQRPVSDQRSRVDVGSVRRPPRQLPKVDQRRGCARHESGFRRRAPTRISVSSSVSGPTSDVERYLVDVELDRVSGLFEDRSTDLRATSGVPGHQRYPGTVVLGRVSLGSWRTDDHLESGVGQLDRRRDECRRLEGVDIRARAGAELAFLTRLEPRCSAQER